MEIKKGTLKNGVEHALDEWVKRNRTIEGDIYENYQKIWKF